MASTRRRKTRHMFGQFDLTLAVIGSLMAAGSYLADMFNLFWLTAAISVVFWAALPAGTTTALIGVVWKRAPYRRRVASGSRTPVPGNYLAMAIGLLAGAIGMGAFGLHLIAGGVDSQIMNMTAATCVALSPCVAVGSLWLWLIYRDATRTRRRSSEIGRRTDQLLAGIADLQTRHRRVSTT